MSESSGTPGRRASFPLVGIGCLPVHAGRLLLTRSRDGQWSSPGGHLEHGESPERAAVRETLEETGVNVRDVEFVAVTNDIMERDGTHGGEHYVTLWFRAEADDPAIAIGDTREIVEAAWFDPGSLPAPRHEYFDNLLRGATLPPGFRLSSLFRGHR